jgi:hypothetical protein
MRAPTVSSILKQGLQGVKFLGGRKSIPANQKGKNRSQRRHLVGAPKGAAAGSGTRFPRPRATGPELRFLRAASLGQGQRNHYPTEDRGPGQESPEAAGRPASRICPQASRGLLVAALHHFEPGSAIADPNWHARLGCHAFAALAGLILLPGKQGRESMPPALKRALPFQPPIACIMSRSSAAPAAAPSPRLCQFGAQKPVNGHAVQGKKSRFTQKLPAVRNAWGAQLPTGSD